MRVIMINGPMGVGKTTIGKCIAQKYAGTAFIDGDWCMDVHPFVGNRETKTMAIDNILHMIDNYRRCSICKMIVVVWLMDEQWVYHKVMDGISDMGLEVKSVVLVCDENSLIDRWKNDKICEWRTQEWLEASLESLAFFSSLENVLDTSSRTVDQIVDRIIRENVI